MDFFIKKLEVLPSSYKYYLVGNLLLIYINGYDNKHNATVDDATLIGIYAIL